MQGIRFINEICKEFDLEVIDAFETRSTIFNDRDCRKCSLIYYVINHHRFTIWISKHKIAITWPSTRNIHRFSISEKYKVLQLIHESLCEEKDLSKK